MDSLMTGVVVDPMDQQICEHAGQVLQQHYPGFEWLVEADRRKGFVDIRNIDLCGGKGWRIKMAGMTTSSDFERQVMLAAGELLERAGLARGAKTELAAEQIDNMPRDGRGNVRYAD